MMAFMGRNRSRTRRRGRWRIARLGLCAALVSGLASSAAAQGLQPLPEGVPARADKRAECYLPGEKRGLRAAVDAGRVPLPGCPGRVVPPRTAVESFTVYAKGSNSVVDCASLRANDASSAYLDMFLADLVDAMDGDAGPACAAAMVGLWAEAGAMTTLAETGSSAQARLDRTWTFGGISAAYFSHPEVRSAARSAGTDPAILAWFSGIAAEVAGELRDYRKRRPENNTQYWRAFALLPTALLTADGALLGVSRGVYDRAMNGVTKEAGREGFLPNELRRGDKALSYQVFAARPLLGMALMSKAYGCSFVDRGRGRERLAQLLARTIEGESDVGIFEAEIERRSGKRVRLAPVRGNADDLLYLAAQADRQLPKLVAAQLARDLGPDAELPAPNGKASQDRLGGGFAALAATVADLREAPVPAGLAEACGGGGR